MVAVGCQQSLASTPQNQEEPLFSFQMNKSIVRRFYYPAHYIQSIMKHLKRL